MLPHQTALLVLAALLSSSYAAPLAQPVPALTISHTNATSGEIVSQEVDTALIHPQLASLLNENKVNINVVTDKAKRRDHLSRPGFLHKRAGIDNSTINLTVISKRNTSEVLSEPEADGADHSVHIDASSGGGEGGGIRDSTININFNGRRSASPEPATTVGQHSVLLDLSSSGDDADGSGIESSTVHVNILPGRADRTIGEHSILIDSSSSSEDSTTIAGDHSAVVDTSSSSENPSKGITSSTVNLTVVAPKKMDRAARRSAKAAEALRRQRVRGKRSQSSQWINRASLSKRRFTLLPKVTSQKDALRATSPVTLKTS